MFRRDAQQELDGATVIPSAGRRWSIARPILFGLILVLFTGCYFYFARHLINHTNGDRNRSDQQNNINLARGAAEDIELDFSEHGSQAIWNWFPRRTDGVVNPLWPWIAARTASVELDDEEFFVHGKWVNVWITIGVLLLGGVVALSRVSLPATLNLLLLVGLGALLPQAVWFQPEPLFYVLFLLAWLAAIAALLKNSAWRYALVGFLCGLAYLAKASALPLLVAFLGVSTLRCFLAGLKTMAQRKHGQSDARWCPQAHVIGAVLCVLAFLTTAGPRLNYANERFGSAFHSYTSYWMWLDQFEPDAIDFMLAHQTKEELEAIPRKERPSLNYYLRKHGSDGFASRLTDGVNATAKDFVSPKRAKERKAGPDPWRELLPDRGIYLYVLAALLLALWVWALFAKPKPLALPQRLPAGSLVVIVFVIGTALLFLALYSWYRPIGKGDRFMMSLYAPLVVSLIWGAECVRERLLIRGTPKIGRLVYYGAHLLLTGAILLRIAELCGHPVFYTK